VVTTAGREMISTVFVSNVSYVTDITTKKEEAFACIFRDDQLKRKSCRCVYIYIYVCIYIYMYVCVCVCSAIQLCSIFLTEKGDAKKISDTVKEAYKVAKADSAAREGNPFMPMSAMAEPVVGSLENAQIPRRDLKALHALGAGEFGEVYLAEYTHEDAGKGAGKGAEYTHQDAGNGAGNGAESGGKKRLCAVKMLRGGSSQDDREAFLREAKVMQGLEHSNMVCVCDCVCVCVCVFAHDAIANNHH
jgi:hypothetical protein